MKSAIYLIKSAGRIKIGFSKNPWKRYRQLCTGCPDPMALVLTYYCDDAPRLERKLHKRFSDKRDKGEWFTASMKEIVHAIADEIQDSGFLPFEDSPNEEPFESEEDEIKEYRETCAFNGEDLSHLSDEEVFKIMHRPASDKEMKGFFASMSAMLEDNQR